MMMKIIIFGPPGVGKGTYSSRIADKLDLVNISTGDIFREHMAQGTKLGRQIVGYMKKGQLVPDEIVIEMMQRRLTQPDCEKGFILDGYPRTVPQAKALENEKIDVIINLIVPDEILIAKCVARRICKDCGDIYNVLNLDKTIQEVRYIVPSMSPKVEGKCDKCGGDLIQRIDDNPKMIKARLDIYREQSKPVAQYYRGRIQFIDLNMTGAVHLMVNLIMEKLTIVIKNQESL
jgi:adenylate kinase